MFTSVQAAIDSITDAGEQNRYMVYIGPGTYNESVVMKPWVYMQGAGQDQSGNNRTIITAPGGNSDQSATVRAASNSALTSITIESKYANPGDTMCACLDCTGVSAFRCYGVNATAYDSPTEPCTILAVVNNRGQAGPTCQVTLTHCVLVAQAQHPKSFAMALWAVSDGTYQVTDSKLIGTGSYVGVGGAGNPGTSMLGFYQCAITGTQYSLQTTDNSVVKAQNCTLVGPVDQGVIVS